MDPPETVKCLNLSIYIYRHPEKYRGRLVVVYFGAGLSPQTLICPINCHDRTSISWPSRTGRPNASICSGVAQPGPKCQKSEADKYRGKTYFVLILVFLEWYPSTVMACVLVRSCSTCSGSCLDSKLYCLAKKINYVFAELGPAPQIIINKN